MSLELICILTLGQRLNTSVQKVADRADKAAKRKEKAERAEKEKERKRAAKATIRKLNTEGFKALISKPIEEEGN